MSLCKNQSNTTWNLLLTSRSASLSSRNMSRWVQTTNFDLLTPPKGALVLFRRARASILSRWSCVPSTRAQFYGNNIPEPSNDRAVHQHIFAGSCCLSSSGTISLSMITWGLAAVYAIAGGQWWCPVAGMHPRGGVVPSFLCARRFPAHR